MTLFQSQDVHRSWLRTIKDGYEIIELSFIGIEAISAEYLLLGCREVTLVGITDGMSTPSK